MSNDKEKLETLQRQQEIFFDLSFDLGFYWASLDHDTRSRAMDHLGGSRGINDRVQHWAGEFDRIWEAKLEVDKGYYLRDINAFGDEKFKALIAELPAATESLFKDFPKDFPKGLTVKELKDAISGWPEVNEYTGEPCDVWIETGLGLSSSVIAIWPLNLRVDEDGKESADIELKSNAFRKQGD